MLEILKVRFIQMLFWANISPQVIVDYVHCRVGQIRAHSLSLASLAFLTASIRSPSRAAISSSALFSDADGSCSRAGNLIENSHSILAYECRRPRFT
jgi:hypothetical protein